MPDDLHVWKERIEMLTWAVFCFPFTPFPFLCSLPRGTTQGTQNASYQCGVGRGFPAWTKLLEDTHRKKGSQP